MTGFALRSATPVASLRAAFFAKRASMHVYPAKPPASSGRKKGSNPEYFLNLKI